MSPRLQRILFTAVTAIAVAVISLYRVPLITSLSLAFDDLHYRLTDTPPSSDIVFVDIDEKSVNRFGRWPWDRALLAQYLGKLAPANSVVLDMVFSEETNPESDAQLADTFAEMGNVICGFFARNEATEQTSGYVRELLSDSSLERVDLQRPHFPEAKYIETNIEAITESCMLNASFATLPDSDVLFRRYPIGIVHDGETFPSLGIQALRLWYDKDVTISDRDGPLTVKLGEREITVDRDGFARLYYHPLDSYQRISFAELARDDFDPARIANKIVILGISEAGVTDIKATPLGETPGPMLHYTFIANVLDGNLLTRSNRVDMAIIVLFALLPLLLGSFLKSVTQRNALYILSFVLYLGASLLLFSQLQWLVTLFLPMVALLVSAMGNELIIYLEEERSGRYLRQAFQSYISPELLDVVSEDPDALKLGGEEKNISVLFSDIRGFTSISESLSPTELVTLLNKYFDPLTRVILNNRGMLDKYIGDAIMAIFNAPLDLADHPRQACKSALEMVEVMERLSAEFAARGLPTVSIGLGINTGVSVVGNMGSTLRFSYTAIGDSVNLASRLEGLTRPYQVNIIISESTRAGLDDTFLTRRLGAVQVKGKHEPIMIYELMGESGKNRQVKALFEEALAAAEQGEAARAEELFSRCADEYGDPTSRFMLENVNQLESEHGVIRFTSK